MRPRDRARARKGRKKEAEEEKEEEKEMDKEEKEHGKTIKNRTSSQGVRKKGKNVKRGFLIEKMKI